MNEELEEFAASVEESTVEETAGDPGETEVVESVSETETVEDSPAPTAEKHDDQTMVPLAAKQAEKERRQKAERELDQLRAQVAQAQNQNKPDFWDNPEQAIQSVEMKVKAQISEEIAKSQHEDYDSVMDHYEDMIKANPSLYVEAMKTGLPAQHAYNVAKKDLELKEIGDISSYREKLKQEILQEIEAQKKSNVPPDMTTVRNAGNDPDEYEMSSNVNDDLFNLLDGRKKKR
ncbi:MAG: hypothetical protein WBP02_00385 [Gammaproteobacteria bacterium]